MGMGRRASGFRQTSWPAAGPARRRRRRGAKGDVLASLDDWSWKAELASSQSKYEAAMMAMQSDLARQSPKAGQDRAQAEYLRAEMQRSQTRLSNAQSRSPIDAW